MIRSCRSLWKAYCSASWPQATARDRGCFRQRGFFVSDHHPWNSVCHYRFFASVAIVGSGPSGCYTAKYLQSAFQHSDTEHEIHVLEQLPTPFGLVRYGVAPDHPEVKNVQNDFSQLFDSISFWGNVRVGQDVSVYELRQMFDVVVLATGCESDRTLGLNKDGLTGILSAREFVAWYNGHPEFGHIGAVVDRALGTKTDKDGIRQADVVVIGQGNVALDCARILAKGSKGLYDTDISSRALPVLGQGVSCVTIVGRRGHIQGAFTIKELRELTKLKKDGFGVSFVVQKEELAMGATDASLQELSGKGGRPKTRIDKLLRDVATEADSLDTSPKQVHLRFLLNPVEFLADESDETSLGAVVCERTTLEGEMGQQKAVGTGIYETLLARLALVSIGYKGVALPGTEQWFDDERGIIRSEHGRIDGATSELGGLYASGWLKRGPSGIIGTNIADAKDTVATIVHDLETQQVRDGKSSAGSELAALLKERNVDVVSWDGYLKIEERESATKRSEAQPREKLTDVKSMLETALS